jgi:hypothetical protein
MAAMRRVTKSELFLELAKLRNEGRLTRIATLRIPGESRGSQFHIIFLKLRSWFSAGILWSS